MQEIRVVRDLRAAAMLMHPMRLRILEHLAEPDSASGVARHLRAPRQKVNYHLRALEARGFLELVGERTVGNSTERLVRAAARHVVLSPRLLGRVAADRGDAPASDTARLLAAVVRIEREVADTEDTEPPAAARTLEAEIRLPAVATDAFLEELRGVVERWSAAGGGPDARVHRLLVSLHVRPSAHATLRDPRPPGA